MEEREGKTKLEIQKIIVTTESSQKKQIFTTTCGLIYKVVRPNPRKPN